MKKQKVTAGKAVISILLVAAIAMTVCGCSEVAKPAPAPNDTNPQSAGDTTAAAEEEKTSFGVGERAQLGNVMATLTGVEESAGSQFNHPGEGNVFLLCAFEIENESDQEISVSSLMSFEAYCDDYSAGFSLGALMEKGDKAQLDGQIAAGKKMSGVVGYEVPADWQTMEIRFTPDLLSGNEIVFTATHE